MDWDAIGAIGEILGALAVVATLGYLAVQIRQNNKQMRSQAYVQLTDALRQLLSDLRQDPEITSKLLATSNDFDGQSEKEQLRAMYYWQDEIQIYQLAHVLWSQGSIDDQFFEGIEDYHLLLLSQPGRRKWWDAWAVMINSDFRQRVNSKLIQLNRSGKDIIDIYPMYRPPKE
jgi:hypothetical protein